MFQVSETPAKPSGLRATTEPNSLHVSLDWDDVDGADSYKVRWRERVRGGQLNEGVSATTSSAGITVAGYGEWVVRVQACNGDNCGRGAFQRVTLERVNRAPTVDEGAPRYKGFPGSQSAPRGILACWPASFLTWH